MTMAWSEAVQRGVGTIEIRQGSATGPLFESFDIASSNRLSLSGTTLTIDPVQTLKDLTQYFVVVPAGGLKDLAGNSYAGTSTYDFTTRAAVPVSIPGSSGDDSLVGGGANDTLIGGVGNDTLDGGGGIDSLLGGLGNDMFYVDSQSDVVIEGVAEGTDTVISSASLYLPGNLENLTLTGTAYFGVGNALDNVVTGSSTENLLLGGAGNDTVRGGDARDAIFGEAGNDAIYGDAGIDYLVAGTGNDTIYAGNNADEAYGEDGNDLIYGGDDFDSDILVGGAGNDTIDGGPAWDQMYGGTGNDTFYASQQVDWVFENAGEGYDMVIADSPNGYYLYANIESLALVGTTPFGVGNDLDNVLIGSAIGNVLLGGPGNDTLDGGAGQDILYGQAGSDAFLIRKGTGIDIIADFAPGTDRIDLSDYGFKSVATARALFQQVGGDVSVNLGNGDTLILMGVQANSIGNADIYTGKINTAPVATAASFSLSENTQKTGTLTASDIDLDPLSYLKVSDPAHGAISLSANGSFTYTPTTNYVGSDTFSFKVNDGNVDSANAVVTFNVANVNNPPTGSVTISPAALLDGGYANVTNSLVDLDGIIGAIRYQWILNGQNVAGATGTDYFLNGLAGSQLSVRASYTDGGSVAESVLSQVVVIGAQPPPPTF
jgi:Ca2+-binding RTX toxin-like protein